jgi:hypothetical protein
VDPRPRLIVSTLLLIVLAASATAAQTPQATICSTQWGWCPLPLPTTLLPGTPCSCAVPGQGYLGGVARFFNYWAYTGRPVSPYLNPHWTDQPPPIK